jgi:hypothetical protein
MPQIRTDDGPRRLRAVWLGPRGARWYWTWTYVQWAVTLLAVVVGVLVVTGLIWLASGDIKVAVIIGPLWGGTVGVVVTKRLMAHVDYDRPLRYWRSTIKGEWKESERLPRRRRHAGSWLSPAEPRTMSRYALAYLGLSSTTLPARIVRPRAPFAAIRLSSEPFRVDHRWLVTANDLPEWAVAATSIGELR